MDENPTEERADYYAEQISELTKDSEAVEKKAQEKIKVWQDWRDHLTNANDNTIQRYSEYIIAFERIQQLSNPKYRYKNPFVKLTHSKNRDKVDWNNEDELISSLEDNGYDDFVKNTKTPKKDDIKKWVTVTPDGKFVSPDGVVLEGVRVIKGTGENVSLKPKKLGGEK